ncbi:M24 family metallopeptidase [Bradyrhizobium sp. SEMIA]|uniref:M24 family metallopeptidase n=1 Tax=Bradyrhizobium sp. SEMIA TaxID=2597515 RepID=UPI0018A50A8C|nr:Xaa-Pro peptidase family protein [Bradyrhizobium sp. SEMIA]QOG21093.1 M24 family metallopeptidase [Bradyrhizobium sp. SEMIA]
MNEPKRPFSNAEMTQRVSNTKHRMQASGIDLLLVSCPANIFYLSGYDACSYYTHQMLIVSLTEDEPILVVRNIDELGALLTVYMKPENVLSYGDEFVGSKSSHPMEFIASTIRSRKLSAKIVAVEMDNYYYSARSHEVLTAQLPNSQLKDADRLVNWVRAVKSSTELEYMMQAGKISSQAMYDAVNEIAPGVRQSQVAAKIYYREIYGDDDHSGEYMCKPPLLPAGRLSATPHLTWIDAAHKQGELTSIELGACRHRYHAPLARAVHLGAPPKQLKDTANILIEGLTTVVESVRPGMTCGEVEGIWRRVINRYGLLKECRIGYPIGIGYPPTWGELTYSLRPSDRTVLEPNMTFHCIPGIWTNEWGLMISESVRMTESGAQCLCEFPRELIVK